MTSFNQRSPCTPAAVCTNSVKCSCALSEECTNSEKGALGGLEGGCMRVEIVLLPADEVSAPAQFSPGERVMGYVFCDLKENLLCTEFKLKLKGEAVCRFEMFASSCLEDESESDSISTTSSSYKSWRYLAKKCSGKRSSSSFQIDSRQMTTHSNRETYVNSVYDILKEDLPSIGRNKPRVYNTETSPKTTSDQTNEQPQQHFQLFSLDKGEYRFPFAFQLPTRIPPSFSSTEGKITYSLSLLLAIPHNKNVFKISSRTVQVVEKQLIASPSMDLQISSHQSTDNNRDVCLLNHNLNRLSPPPDYHSNSGGGTNSNIINNRCCLPAVEGEGEGGGVPEREREVSEEAVIGCCMPDHLDLTVGWDRDCYSPGDVVQLHSTLSTTAPKEVSVHGGYINLIQVVSYTGKDGAVKVKENSVCRRDFLCHPLSQFPLPIPPNIPPSHMQHCSFIHINYILRFKLYTEFTTMETKWTIKIGWPKAISPSPTSQYAYLPSTPARENNNNNNSNSNNNNPRENEDPRFGRSLDVDRCLDLSGRGVVTSTRRERDSEQPRPRSEFYSRGYERLYCNSSRSNNKPTSGLQLDAQSSAVVPIHPPPYEEVMSQPSSPLSDIAISAYQLAESPQYSHLTCSQANSRRYHHMETTDRRK